MDCKIRTKFPQAAAVTAQPRATVSTPPRVTAAEQTAEVRVQGDRTRDYMALSCAMVLLCLVQCNIPALICAVQALDFSTDVCN